MATKYKGSKAFPYLNESETVTRYFTEGKYYKRYPNGTVKKFDLEEGSTKYNLEMLRKVKEVSKKFSYLICMELYIVNVVREHFENSFHVGIIGNLWHIINAQKGTVGYLGVVEDALKKYKIKHEHILNNMNTWIEHIDKRAIHNTSLYPMFLEQAGLKPLSDCFDSKLGISIFEYISSFTENFFFEHRFEYDTIEEYYEARNEALIDNINDFAIDNGINIGELLESANNEYNDKIAKIKNEIKEDNAKKREAKKIALAKAVIVQNDAKIMDAIMGRNKYKKTISAISESTLMENLLKYNGICYVIDIVLGSKVYYYSDIANNNKTQSLYKAKFFINKEEAKKVYDIIKEDDPKHYMEINRIALPEKLNSKDTEIVDLENVNMEIQNKALNSMIESRVNSHINFYQMESFLIENDDSAWYICAIDRNTRKVCYFNENHYNNIRLSDQPTFYPTELTAKAAIVKYQDMVDLKFKLVAYHFKYTGSYTSLITHNEEFDNKLNNFVENYNSGDIELKFKIFNYNDNNYKAFEEKMDNYGEMTIIVSQGISYDFNFKDSNYRLKLLNWKHYADPKKRYKEFIETYFIRELYIEHEYSYPKNTDEILNELRKKNPLRMYKKITIFRDGRNKIGWK